MKIVLSTLNAKYIHSSLALYYLKAYCDNGEDDWLIKEYSVNNGLLEVLSDLYGARPDIIGLACYIWNMEMTLQLVSLIRKVLPKAVIILGGPEVSYDGEKLMGEKTEIDFIIQGEGEEALAQLLEHLKGDRDLSGISGLIYWKEEKILRSGGPQVVRDIGTIPFPYADEDIAALKDKIIYYESSRGCPFSCQYCLSSATLGVRFLPLPRVFKELEFFITHGVKQVKFVDRTFNARKEHYLPIIEFLAAAQDCRTNFHFEIAADILDDESIAALAKAPVGRFQLEIGIQSTHEPTLKVIHRTNNWPRIVENVETLRSFGNIHLHLDLIAGLPYEGFERFGKSFDDVYNLKPHMLQLGFLKLLKGSGIRERADTDGYVFMDSTPYEVLSNKYISYAEIRALKIMEEVFNQTYNSGRFGQTLAWFIKEYGSAFLFFRRFAAYWEQCGLHLVSHSPKTIYQIFANYCEQYHPEGREILLELLKFDALMSDHGAVRPEFLLWNGEEWNAAKSEFFRNNELVERYVPEYQFANWRYIKKNYHIELFRFDVTNIEAMNTKETILLFIYTGDTILHKKLELSDLNREGKGII